jgi:hypothetical protein
MRVNAWLLAIVAALSAISPVLAADKAKKSEKSGNTIEVSLEPQQWQMRRSETIKAFNAYYGSDGKDKAAEAKVDAILTNIEKAPWSITPMEAMDIYGTYYVPYEGEKNIGGLLEMISMFAVVGLYDANRFGDASARAEIMNNEGFLKRPFTLGGEAGVNQLVAFLQQHPKEAEAAVSAGANKAARLAELAQYDVQWPTAYGLTRMTCAMEGKKNCPPPKALSKDKWNQAFTEAVQTVQYYYRDNSKK